LIGVELGLPLLRLTVQPKNCRMRNVMGEDHLAQHRSRPRYVDELDYGKAVEVLVACEHKEVEETRDGRIHIVGNHQLGLGNHKKGGV
jgi:hypothetical protein